MNRQNIWRGLVTLAIALWCFSSIVPVKDKPFGIYIKTRATANKEEFKILLESAEKSVHDGESKTMFLALRDISKKDQIDLSKYFKDINVADIKNLEKKNKILLNELLSQSQSKIKQGLDLKGGLSCVMKIDDKNFDSKPQHVRTSQLSKAIEVMRQRIDGLGVAEPIIRPIGEDSIEIQLPGVSTRDNPEILNAIKKPAKLEFRLVSDEPASKNSRAPSGYELLEMRRDDGDAHGQREIYAFVKKIPEMTGKYVKNAGVVMDQYGAFEIALSMTEAGTKKFESITTRHIGKRLGIVLDGELYSAPVILSAIPNGNASISGNFSQRDATELSNVLNNPLEFELKVAEINEVGPSIAESSRTSSMIASAVGIGLVVVFMVGYYFTAGIISVLAVFLNVFMVLGVMASIGATLTLPGIAALVLTVGMAVDANILIFERMREELRIGRSLRDAIAAGHEKAFSAIFDSNLTTLMTALILTFFGTGPVKGFGIILGIGMFSTMFCALVFSRLLLEIVASCGCIENIMPHFAIKKAHFNFFKHWKKAFVASWAIVALGVVAISVRGSTIFGIDFTGGDEINVALSERIDTSKIELLAKSVSINDVSVSYQRHIGDENEFLRVQTPLGYGKQLFVAIEKQFPNANPQLIKECSIGGSVSEGIKSNAFYAIVLSIIGILLYIAFRFELGYGLGAVVSTVHDVLLTVGIYVMLGKQFSAPMVASILMLIGYSINDTIIVFDRIREELVTNPVTKLKDVINLAINKTLSRTILTSLTTFMAALSLFIFGTGVIHDLSLIFVIGIIVGTFSSIFIASPVFYWWHRGNRVSVEAAEKLPSKEWDTGK